MRSQAGRPHSAAATRRIGRCMARLAPSGMLILAACLAGVLSAAVPASPGDDRELARATFAGGCFWCMEPPYDRLEGVVETISGFSGGQLANPS